MQIPSGIKFVNPDGFEVCVLCHEKADPPVLFSACVDERAGYVEGCGQTCANTALCKERRSKKSLLNTEGILK